MGEKNARRKPQQGVVDVRPSGALRVRVDAGIDPVTGKRHRLVEHVPADTPNKEAVAEQIRVRLMNQVNERRHPRTSATVSQLLDRYLNPFDGAFSTVNNYRSLRKNHIEPFIGLIRVDALDADVLDSLYVELQRCRLHCTGPFIEHRMDQSHGCDERCRPHRCRPLGRRAFVRCTWHLAPSRRPSRRSRTSPAGPPLRPPRHLRRSSPRHPSNSSLSHDQRVNTHLIRGHAPPRLAKTTSSQEGFTSKHRRPPVGLIVTPRFLVRRGGRNSRLLLIARFGANGCTRPLPGRVRQS
jgi:integrase